MEDFIGLKRKISGFDIMEGDAVEQALARAQQLANRVEPPKTAERPDLCSLPTLILGEPGVSVPKQHSLLVNRLTLELHKLYIIYAIFLY